MLLKPTCPPLLGILIFEEEVAVSVCTLSPAARRALFPPNLCRRFISYTCLIFTDVNYCDKYFIYFH